MKGKSNEPIGTAKAKGAVSDLSALISGMSPKLSGGGYFIAPFDEGQLMELANYIDYVLAIFREEEGLTVVFSEDVLEDLKQMSEKEPAGPFALITLGVQSDLMAVGFLARITEALAEKGISVNAYSAFYHDHLLVPYARKDEAVAVLSGLSSKTGTK